MSYSSYRRLGARIYEAADFVFEPPAEIVRARRVLIKPAARYPLPPPATTSRTILEVIINSIRKVSEADILFLEGSPEGEPMQSIYRALQYNFPRVLTLDVRDCVLVEVENPLDKPFAMATFWLPNVVLSCDYLLSVAPSRPSGNRWGFSIENLLSLLPVEKYRSESPGGGNVLFDMGIENVLADLYFTLPFDMGIIELHGEAGGTTADKMGEVRNRIVAGEPYEADSEAARILGLDVEHLRMIKNVRGEFADQIDNLEHSL